MSPCHLSPLLQLSIGTCLGTAGGDSYGADDDTWAMVPVTKVPCLVSKKGKKSSNIVLVSLAGLILSD